jgi:hypothetical protein
MIYGLDAFARAEILISFPLLNGDLIFDVLVSKESRLGPMCDSMRAGLIAFLGTNPEALLPDCPRVSGTILLLMYVHVAHHRGQAEIYLPHKGIKPLAYRV